MAARLFFARIGTQRLPGIPLVPHTPWGHGWGAWGERRVLAIGDIRARLMRFCALLRLMNLFSFKNSIDIRDATIPGASTYPGGGTLPLPTSDNRGIVPISPRGEKSSANREKPQVATIIVQLPGARLRAACGRVRPRRRADGSGLGGVRAAPPLSDHHASATRPPRGRTGGHGLTPERACLGKLTSNDIK